MPDRVNEFVRRIDEARDFTVVAADRQKQSAMEDIDDLMRSPDGRDEELWGELGVDLDATSLEYEQEEDRDLEWLLGLSGLSAAASTQYLVDNVRSLIVEPLAYQVQMLSGFELTRAELIAAGKRGTVGPLAETVVSDFQAIQARYLKEFAFLEQYSPLELYQALAEADALIPFEKQLADAMGYVSRMTAYRPGSPQFKEAVSNLVNHNSTRVLKASNRRAVERLWTERESNGDRNTLMVWMGEGGANTCSFCLDRFGEIKTLAEWERDGLPGADVCAGGDNCKCILTAA